MEADYATAVPEVEQGVVDDNDEAAMSYANADINHTYTVKPTGPAHTKTNNLINSSYVSDEEE